MMGGNYLLPICLIYRLSFFQTHYGLLFLNFVSLSRSGNVLFDFLT